jgi:hypothetical protein
MENKDNYIIFFIENCFFKDWVETNICNAKIKQITNTSRSWAVVLEKTVILRDYKIVNFLIDNSYEHCKLIISNDDVELIESKLQLSLNCTYNYHHLLPGIIIQTPTRHLKEIIILINSFPTFFDAFKTIEYLVPPENSSVLHFNQSLLQLQTKDQTSLLTDLKENNLPSNIQRKLIIPTKAVSFLIGKKGVTIEKIRQQTTATIKILPQSYSQDKENYGLNDTASILPFLQTVLVSGTTEETEIAVKLIEAQLHRWSLTINR